MSVYDEQRHPWLPPEKRFIEEAIKKRKIVLAICLGSQLIADVLGARILRNRFKEIGWFPIEMTTAARLRKPQAHSGFARLHEELQHHPRLTLQLAWKEYRQAHPHGHGRFCGLYQQRLQRLDVVLRQEHKAGEKLVVDYAGEMPFRKSEVSSGIRS